MMLQRLGLVAIFGLMMATAQAKAGAQDFILMNKTGVDIHALRVSSSGDDEWGDDILGADVLENGDELLIKFSPGEKAALWDLRIEDEKSEAIEWGRLNLIEITKITLKYNAKTGEATASIETVEEDQENAEDENAEEDEDEEAAAQDFVLVNRTGVDIHALRVSSSGDDEWGDDILGADVLGNGDELLIKFSPKEESALWDLRIEDEDGNSIEWERLNLLEISKVTLRYNKTSGEAKAQVE
ncbi:MAG TPA: hypothetical protein DCS43_17375 [Verrucomicrobia bacterium]|nr:hypothetical protein [Verrucomicrobiota bacterium]